MNSSVFTKSPEDYKIHLNELNILPSLGNSSTNYIVLKNMFPVLGKREGRG